MKRIYCVLLLLLLAGRGMAQSEEIEQLLLDIEKLTNLKKILQQMKDGVQILYSGYTKVRDISAGNYSLHALFLDGLLEVSPAVRDYQRVKDLVLMEGSLLREGKVAWQRFQSQGSFTAAELRYIGNIYEQLVKASGENITSLLLILTSGTLRMDDEERLKAIDRLYTDAANRYRYQAGFTGQASILSLQRIWEKGQVDISRKISGQ